VTKDGGQTWSVTKVGEGADTLMAARDLEADGEGWAFGGQLSASMILGAFHTRVAADFASKERGYAAVVTNMQQSSMIYYK
jgi:hypothetical protein